MPRDSDNRNIEVTAIGVSEVTVSGDGRRRASIVFQIDVGKNLEVSLSPELLAKLEAMLMQASLQQAEDQPLQ